MQETGKIPALRESVSERLSEKGGGGSVPRAKADSPLKPMEETTLEEIPALHARAVGCYLKDL